MIILNMWQLLLLILPFVVFALVGVTCWCIYVDRYDKKAAELEEQKRRNNFLIRKLTELNGIKTIKTATAYYNAIMKEYENECKNTGCNRETQ